MYKGMKFSPYFRALEEIFKQNEGRPHWGKMHTLNQEELLKRYPKMKDFMIYRKQLDEHGIFMNEYMKSLFMRSKKMEERFSIFFIIHFIFYALALGHLDRN